MSLLDVKNLHASVGDKPILNGINLTIGAGEVHAIMGPNGSGKSTLSHVLSGHESYSVNQGEITYLGKDLSTMTIEERAQAGLFLAFQYPVEIPGVTTMNFIRASLNAVRKARGLVELDAVGVLKLLRTKAGLLGMTEEMLKRALNVGFSGGEKKRNDILQMLILEPTLALLDETDSGLDIDALKMVATGVNTLRSPERSMLVITHYQRLLNYLTPDFVHVMIKGKIVRSGGAELAKELEENGYVEWSNHEAAE